MIHYHYFIDGICENCGERKIDIDIESAERAIVEAADRWQRAEAEWEAANREWNIAGMREPGVSDADRERFYPALAEVRQARENIKNAVDSWRKLKGKA